MKDYVRKGRGPFLSAPTWLSPTSFPQQIALVMTFFYTYVLFSQKDHRLYIGFTTDLEKRVKAHNQGENKSTRSRRPFQLIYFEGHTRKSDALRREAYFKTTSGKRTLKKVLLITIKRE